MKKWEAMEESKDCQIAELEREHRQAITEYEADLNAANGRLHLVQEELRLANESWASAKRELTAAHLMIDRLNTNCEGAYVELEDAKAELNLLRAQLQRVRAAEGPLHRALYPETFPLPTLPFPFIGLPGPTGTILSGVIPDGLAATWNVPTSEDVEDRMDRLNEAGYSCATEKRNLSQRQVEQYRGYSGLVA